MELPGIAKKSTTVDAEALDQKDGLKMVQDHQIRPKKIEIKTNSINLCDQIKAANP